MTDKQRRREELREPARERAKRPPPAVLRLKRRAFGEKRPGLEDLEALIASRGQGLPPPPTIRDAVQAVSGRHLGPVRLHDDDVAHRIAESLGARAASLGNDVFFASGQLQPDTAAGWRLIAHELVHATQPTAPSERLRVEPAGSPAEREADQLADLAVASRTTPLTARNWRGLAERGPGAAPLRLERDEGRHVTDEPTSPVNKLGVIGGRGLDPETGQKRLYAVPLPNQSPSEHVKANSFVSVLRENGHGWYYISTLDGRTGWVEKEWVGLDPPDPNARLHPVGPGEMLKDIVARYYKPQGGFDSIHNARLYVEAVKHVNEQAGRGAAFRYVDASLSWWERAKLNAENEKTALLFRSIQPIAGRTIWIPSQEFVEYLRGRGFINKHGGSARAHVLSMAKDALYKLAGWAVEGVGFVGGILYGAVQSVVEVFTGMVDLLETVLKVFRSVFSGEVAEDARALWASVKQLLTRETCDRMFSEFSDKWFAESPWDRGFFRGRVVGYVLAEIAMAVISGGSVTSVKWGGKLGKLGAAISKSQKIHSVAEKLAKAKRLKDLPKGAAEYLKRRFGKKNADKRPDPPKKSREKRKEELSKDPENADRVTPGTVREAEVALQLEEAGRLPPPVRRPDLSQGETGDFVDGTGQAWDVKAPRSRDKLEQELADRARAAGKPPPKLNPRRKIKGEFSLEKELSTIRHEIANGEKVIIDTANLNAQDLAALKQGVADSGLGANVLFH